jgi:adenylate kinase family enzyme
VLVRFLDGIEEAAPPVRSATRILVFGCSGSGKRTLAQALAARRGLDYVSLDRGVFWLAGWKMRDRPEALQRMEELSAGPRWIIDGNSPGSLHIRLAKADLALWCRPPRLVSLRGIFGRWMKYRGQVRPEMADGCPERISWKFLKYVWNFERDEVPEFADALARHGGVRVLVLRSYRESNMLLAAL